MTEAANVSYRYEGADEDALKDVTVSFEPGEISALVGPNGSGKTTLLKYMAGVIGGRNEGNAAILLQESRPPLDMTVFDYVMCARYSRIPFFGFPSANDVKVVREAMKAVGLADFASVPLGEMSSGQRQLARIAQLVAQESNVCFLDEPTTFLDLAVQQRIFGILKELAHQDGRTIVISIHDLHTASRFCDRLYMMKEGRLLHSGSPDRVLTAENVREVFDVDEF